MTLPPGIAAKFAGVQECSEAHIAQAQVRGNPGQGALEQQSPSCPAASRIGAVNVGAGSGNPIYVQGNVYPSRPLQGAPFSIAIITPGVTGPFDIGTVVVRASLYVNEETGLNPTSYEAKAITAEAISTTGAVAQLQNRFQVGGCKGLDYTPKLALSLKSPTNRSGHPKLREC